MAATTNTTMSDFAPSSHGLPPLPSYTLEPLSPVIPGIPDAYLTLALPVIAYWGVSMLFHFVDEWDLFPQYRLHTPAEVLKRNHVSRWEVFRDVILQQIIQTVVGFALTYFEDEPTCGKEAYEVAVWAQRLRLAQRVVPMLLGAIGLDSKSMASSVGVSHPTVAGILAGGSYSSKHTAPSFASWELAAAQFIYYYAIPGLQFFAAICVVDTWQYFLHRAMHMNKWLYTTFHSRHHKLYVPYAYGALYNHPFEGFLLDTLGTGIAYIVTGMTVRQSMWFFTCSTIKTVDDHCGYAFPWDPLQHVTSNNAGYHDVHHQSWGIKTNFSQPFFTFWDSWLGTKWTGGDVSARYERARNAAQRKVDADAKAITASSPAESVQARSDSPYTKPVRAVDTLPSAPSTGKANAQALSSRAQVLESTDHNGAAVLQEEEREEIKELRRSPRKRSATSTTSAQQGVSGGLNRLADRVDGSLRGRRTGVLGVDSRR